MKLLVVCFGNTCRSPMLMTLVRDELRRRGITNIDVESAGTDASCGAPASREAAAAMTRCGLDLQAHSSRDLRDVDLASFDHVYAMTSRQADCLRSLGVPATKLTVVNAANGGVPDPAGGGMEDYEACARMLKTAAREIVDELADHSQPSTRPSS